MSRDRRENITAVKRPADGFEKQVAVFNPNHPIRAPFRYAATRDVARVPRRYAAPMLLATLLACAGSPGTDTAPAGGNDSGEPAFARPDVLLHELAHVLNEYRQVGIP